MKNKIAVIIGSSRKKGNTKKVVEYFESLNLEIEAFDLNNYQIGYYDYEFKNSNDDFLKLYKKLLEYDTLVFATPIYWYTMSAQMKTFFDRISDTLHGENKKFGRLLKGKSLAVISCGSDAELFEGFDMPFRESANYLGMHYKGHVHTWIDDNQKVPAIVKNSMQKFATIL